MVRISDHRLVRYTLLPISAEVVFNIVWLLVDPLTPTTFVASNGVTNYQECSCARPALWGGLAVATKTLPLLYALLLAHQTRNVPAEFNEVCALACCL